MKFKKYQKVVKHHKLRQYDLDSFLKGDLHVFPKVDGANASIWLDNGGRVCIGSRTRELRDEGFNGFREFVDSNEFVFKMILEKINAVTEQDCTIYGEWMVPHSIRYYKEIIWKKFWIFDVVFTDPLERENYVHYDVYSSIISGLGYEYVLPRLAHYESGIGVNELLSLPQLNRFKIEEEGKYGEGVVIKCYDLCDRPWVKVLHEDFSNGSTKKEKVPRAPSDGLEEKLVEEFLDEAIIQKEVAKINMDEPELEQRRFIPRLFNQVFDSFIEDEFSHIMRKYKMPLVDFRKLNKAIQTKIRITHPEFF